MRGLATFASLLLAMTCVGCGDDAASSDAEDVTAGGCAILGSDGTPLSTSARADSDDAFFLNVLAKGSGSCPTTADGAFDRMTKVFANGFLRSVVVSELADEEKTTTPYRFVVTAGTDGNPDPNLFLSVAGTPSDGLVEGLVEAMGFSPSKQAYAFYAVKGGKWQRMGDATEIGPDASKPFECVACHPTGAPNMKELTSPWNNWSGNRITKIPKSSKKGFSSVASEGMTAYALETVIEAGASQAVKGYVARLLEQKQLKTLLRHVMCDVGEPTFVSSAAQNAHRFKPYQGPDVQPNLPGAFLADPHFPGGFGSLDRDAYEAAVRSVTQTFSDGTAGDTIFALFVPERSFVDTAIVNELKRRKRLSDDTLKDLLFTDFTNPVYSKVRCDLVETAPNEGTNAEAVRTAWIANLAASALPGAAELGARLADTGDAAAHDAAVQAFADVCSARSDQDPNGYALDLVRLASQRRRELEEVHPDIVESDFLLPFATSKAPAAHELMLDPKTCKLVSQ